MDTTIVLHVNPWLLVLIAVWSLPWKAVAVWKAARLSNKVWFIILLLVQSMAILDIIFIYFVARKYTVDTMEKVETH